MAITDWPADERPRERLLAHGAAALSDAELLAIFLRVGVRGMSAVDLARTLITRFGSLGRLFAAGPADIAAVAGMGNAKYAQLQAVLEMARRALAETLSARELLSSPETVRDYLRLGLGRLDHEVFVALWLNTRNQLLASEELFRGTLSQTAVYPREIVKRALAHNAAAVIFAHNHPGGTPDPSTADLELTARLQAALKLVDVRVLDHFIVAGSAPPVSLAERGRI